MYDGTFHEQLSDLGVTAGMNQRYHLFISTAYSFVDSSIRATLGGLALATLVIAFSVTDPWASQVVAVIAAFAAMLNLIFFAQASQRHSELYAEWNRLLSDIDTLLLEAPEDPKKAATDRLVELHKKMNTITEHERGTVKIRRILKWCQAEEEISRGCTIEQAHA